MVMMGVMTPTERMMIVMKSCGSRLRPFTRRPPMGSTETIVAGMITMAKVNGMILALIQSIKLWAAS